MGKARENLRVVLIQIRDHEDAAEQELLCFLERCRLRPERLETINVVEEPDIRWERVDGADAMLIGGAGAHSATEDHPFTAPLTDVVLRWIDTDRPLFGSCWGHQFLAAVLGGSVVADMMNEEVGSLPITLNEAGRADPLFAGFPERFVAQLGHHDRIGDLPDELVPLAASDRCAVQAVRLPGKPVYGSQFHSEMTVEHMRARLLMYRDEYLPPSADPAILEGILAPSPEAEGLLDRFLTLYT